MPQLKQRCWWCGVDPIYVAYHDKEWGVPELDDRALFEKLILDGFQAGLSWITILKKREAFRKAFHNFDPHRMAKFDARDKNDCWAMPELFVAKVKLKVPLVTQKSG